MCVERLFAFRSTYARARSIRQDPITLLVIDQIRDHDLIEHLFMHGWIEDRHKRFYAPVEVARHQVGRGNVDMGFGVRQIMPATEAKDTRMFEKPADNRLHPDAIGETLYSRPQTTNAANDKIYVHAGLTCLIKGVDNFGIDQGIAFCPNRTRLAGFHKGDFLRDMIEKPLLE